MLSAQAMSDGVTSSTPLKRAKVDRAAAAELTVTDSAPDVSAVGVRLPVARWFTVALVGIACVRVASRSSRRTAAASTATRPSDVPCSNCCQNLSISVRAAALAALARPLVRRLCACAAIVRTRKDEVIAKALIAIDVGGVYSPDACVLWLWPRRAHGTLHVAPRVDVSPLQEAAGPPPAYLHVLLR